MIAEKNVRIPVGGGFVLADVFRPDSVSAGGVPALVTVGVYGKDVPFRDFNHSGWKRSELKSGQGARDHMVGETPLPDFWVGFGYAVVRCDQPGSGDSPGDLDVFGPAAQTALYEAIEWAAVQEWSNGRIGVLGASYYGVMGWLAAAQRPPHLAALMPFQGFTDHYRDCVRHGGILTAAFVDGWFGREVLPRQYGAQTGTSSEKLPPAELISNTAHAEDYRSFLRGDALRYSTHPYYVERSVNVEAIEIPVFVWANVDGLGLHLRGTIDGFERLTNAEFRSLMVYSGSEPDAMYSRQNSETRRRFFDRFLKLEANGFEDEPRVRVTVRRNGRPHIDRIGTKYPLEGSENLTLYLDAGQTGSLCTKPGAPASTTYRSEYEEDGLIGGLVGKAAALVGADLAKEGEVRFLTPPMERDLELNGPMCLTLHLSADAPDADLFVAVRELSPDGSEVKTDIGRPISLGWLRASMRHADIDRSTALRAWHTYDRTLSLKPGELVKLEVNIWPAAWIVAAGNRLALDIAGHDQKGCGEFKHPPIGLFAPDGKTPIDNGSPRPANVTIYTGGAEQSRLVCAVFRPPTVGAVGQISVPA